MVTTGLSPDVHQSDRLGRVLTPPFEGDGVWLRCALHAHTTNSDGELAPDMLVRHYEWAGYDVLAITDHWVRTEERSTRKLLVIPSTELNATCGPSEDDAHVLALGVEADPEPPDSFAPLQEVVDWIRANGGLPYLAHTYWSGLRTEQWEPCEGLLGIEVWNTGCELEIGGAVRVWRGRAKMTPPNSPSRSKAEQKIVLSLSDADAPNTLTPALVLL
jgi:hypothetical protein